MVGAGWGWLGVVGAGWGWIDKIYTPFSICPPVNIEFAILMIGKPCFSDSHKQFFFSASKSVIYGTLDGTVLGFCPCTLKMENEFNISMDIGYCVTFD